MEIKLYHFNKDNVLSLEDDIDFSSVHNPIPQIDTIVSTHVKVDASKYDELVVLSLSIDAVVDAVSSYTGKIDKYPLNIKEDVTLSLVDTEDSDYDVIKGNSIDIDEYVYSLIIASMPISVIFKGESLTKDINGVKITSEEEYMNKKSKSSPFDVLDELFDDKK